MVLDWIREREAWAARHFEDGSQFRDEDLSPNLSNIAGIVAQVKWGTVGVLGADRMIDILDQMKVKLEERQLTPAIEKGLENKLEEHKEDVGDDPRKQTTLATLEKVFDRGVGAYKTNPESVRSTVTSPRTMGICPSQFFPLRPAESSLPIGQTRYRPPPRGTSSKHERRRHGRTTRTGRNRPIHDRRRSKRSS